MYKVQYTETLQCVQVRGRKENAKLVRYLHSVWRKIVKQK